MMEEPVKSYRDLSVWQLSMSLARSVYQSTVPFPKDEQYGLTSQLRRAAISIPSNIAEGRGRDSTKEFLRHLSFAQGSLAEVETQLILSRDLGYLTEERLGGLLATTAELGRMIHGLQRSLRSKLTPDP
jgi:four helix bundle protein